MPLALPGPALGLLVLAVLAFAPPPVALAVSIDLDDSQFIRGLRERGMRDLLHHHLDHHPPEDRLEELATRVELFKLDFEDDQRSAEQRSRAVDDALAAYRDLIEQAPRDHHQRPLWRTEMAEFILRVALPVRHLNAGEFVEFGLPTRSARQRFDELALEAYEQIEQAYLESFELQGDLPRQDDFQAAFVNTGFWTLLNRDFIDRRIPFAYGWASHYATLASEPAGSSDEALEQLNRVNRRGLNEQARAELDSLIGRVLIRAGEYGEAEERLREVREATAGDLTGQGLWARLAWVQALEGAEQEQEAVEAVQAILDDFRQTGAISPPLVILVHDAWYRVTGDYAVYEEHLFEDPLVADFEEQVRAFVVQRLADDPLTPEELADEAPLVVFAHVDRMLEQAAELRDHDRGASDEQFATAQRVLHELSERPDVDDRTQARTRFRLGALEFQRGRPADAVEVWVELAQLLPEEPKGVNAAVNAFNLANQLYRQHRDNQSVIELFDQASETLLEKQPDHRVARQHTYTRAAFLRRQRRFDEAITAYYDVPADHDYYADALYEVAVIYHTLWVEAEPERRAQRGRQTLEAVDAALTALDRTGNPSERRDTLTEKHGDALLLKAEVLLQQLDDASAAERVLGEFDERFVGFDDLQQMYERLRVNVAVSLGRFDEARQRVHAFAERGAGEGGALIQRALDSVNRRAEDLREDGETEEADRLDQLGVNLAQDLVEWANQQAEYREDPRARLPLELILARQLRAAGDLAGSREMLEALYEQPMGVNAEGEAVTGAEQLDVLYDLAVTAKEQDDLDRARPLINRILRQHPSQEGRTWWHSWLMALQIRDARYTQLMEAGEEEEARQLGGEIFRNVRQLHRLDEHYGGGPWQREFERLSRRHHPN